MKKKIANQKLLVLISIAFMVLFVGCTNDDYDFDNVDMTLGIGGERLSLPGNNSTADIVLEDLLNIEGSDLITTTADGDYMFGKDPVAVNPVTVTVNPITLLSDQSASKTIDINIPSAVLPFAGMVIKPSDYQITIEDQQTISLQDYEFNVPQEVKSLEYVGLGNNGVGLTLNLTIPEAIKKFDYIYVKLPQVLEMTCISKPAFFDTSTNTLRIENYTPSSTEQFKFSVTGLNVKTVGNDDYAELKDGKLRMHGKISFGYKIAELKVPSESTIHIGGEAMFEDLTVTSARGIFDPAINLQEAGSVQINSIPDFLLDDEVVVDLDNPQILLTVRSTMPLGGTVKAFLRSDTYQQGISLDTPGRIIQVKASPDGATETTTQILLCRHNPGVNTSDYQVIEIEELSELVTTLKEGMKIDFLIKEVKAVQETATILLGHEYRVGPSYHFSAPLAFGSKATIVYHKTFNDWNGDLKNFSLMKDAYIQMTGTAVNRLPANLELSVTPIGTDGQALTGLNVELIKKEVAGTKDAAQESPIEFKITDTTGTAARKLDGVKVRLKASSNENLRGVTLNKKTQTLKLKDMKVGVIGRLIYDAN